MDSTRAYTVEQFIELSSNKVISYESLSLVEKIDNITTITYNLLNDYKEEFEELTISINMTDSEFLRYQFKPKLLAYDIYGDPELYFIILFLNNICNIKEFNNKKIKMLKKDDLVKLISAIYNAETDSIQRNREKLEI